MPSHIGDCANEGQRMFCDISVRRSMRCHSEWDTMRVVSDRDEGKRWYVIALKAVCVW